MTSVQNNKIKIFDKKMKIFCTTSSDLNRTKFYVAATNDTNDPEADGCHM